MPLTLCRDQLDPLPVDVTGILPETVRDKSLAQIERLLCFQGNRQMALGELFRVTGNADDGTLVWQGQLRQLQGLGAGMRWGAMCVESSVGRHVGAQMQGGSIVVQGDAGDWLGAELQGGQITVVGNAGNLAGAAYRGSPVGMRGGTLLIHGHAGHEAGRAMRRGLLAIGGDCGAQAGWQMLAGTILVGGQCGPRPAAEMRRGTLALLQPECPTLLPTFAASGTTPLLALDLVLRQLQAAGGPFADWGLPARWRIFHGDLLQGGRGELLWAES